MVDFRDCHNFLTFVFTRKLFLSDKLLVCWKSERTFQWCSTTLTLRDHVITSVTIWSRATNFRDKQIMPANINRVNVKLYQSPTIVWIMFINNSINTPRCLLNLYRIVATIVLHKLYSLQQYEYECKKRNKQNCNQYHVQLEIWSQITW